MAGWRGLEPVEELALQLAAEDNHFQSIAERLGLKETQVRQRLFPAIYRKLGVKTIQGATAMYGNHQGLRGAVLSGADSSEYTFRLGPLQVAGKDVSTELRHPSDLTCLVTDEPYAPPREIAEQLHYLRAAVIRRSREREEVLYERPGRACLIVAKLESVDETYCPLTLTLQEVPFITQLAIKRGIGDQKLKDYAVNPFCPGKPALPLTIGASLFIVAPDDHSRPQLVIIHRDGRLANGQSLYASTSQAYAESERDVGFVEGRRTYDFIHTMVREFQEERGVPGIQDYLKRSIRLLGLTFDNQQLAYSVHGYAILRGVSSRAIRDTVSSAKEGEYSCIDFPVRGGNVSQGLRRLARHLIDNPWVPSDAIGLVLLLQREFGKQAVHEAFDSPFVVPGEL